MATIDGLTRFNARQGRPFARYCGALFSFGHGLVVIAIRVVFQVFFGATVGGSTVLFRLPSVELPEWAAGVRIGGAVTLEAVVLAVYDGMRLAAILACIGAANSLADPRRLLKSVPGALYETGVAVVVALSFAPRLPSKSGASMSITAIPMHCRAST